MWNKRKTRTQGYISNTPLSWRFYISLIAKKKEEKKLFFFDHRSDPEMGPEPKMDPEPDPDPYPI